MMVAMVYPTFFLIGTTTTLNWHDRYKPRHDEVLDINQFVLVVWAKLRGDHVDFVSGHCTSIQTIIISVSVSGGCRGLELVLKY